jgi:lauroyl/myristoyl acyltransferase
VRGAAIILRILPFSLAVSIGELLGRVAHLVDRRHREVAFKNLALIFNGKERKKLIPS